MRNTSILALMAALVFMPLSAKAQDKLGFEMLIRKHFEYAVSFYNGVDVLDSAAVAAYARQYVDEGAQYKVVSRSNLRDNPKEVSQNRDEFIASLEEGKQELRQPSFKYTIVGIKVSEDGNTAEVRYTGLMKGVGRTVVQATGKLSDIVLSSYSDCIEKFIYVDEKTIKSIGADCQIDATYQSPVPVQ